MWRTYWICSYILNYTYADRLFLFFKEIDKGRLILGTDYIFQTLAFYIIASICRGSRVRAPWDGRLCFLALPPPFQCWKSPPPPPWRPACPSSEPQGSFSYPPVVEGDTGSVSKCIRILRMNSHLLTLIGRICSTLESFLRHFLRSPHLLLSSVRSHLTLFLLFPSYYHLNVIFYDGHFWGFP